MSLPGSVESVVQLLRRRFSERLEDDPLRDWNIRSASAGELKEELLNQVTLFPYRIDLDPTRRHQEVRSGPGEPQRVALVVDVALLLIVWGNNAATDLSVLGFCMEILEGHSLLTSEDLDPNYNWAPGWSFRITLDSIPTDNLLQLWDALLPSYRLCVPYRLRPVLLDSSVVPAAVPIGAVGLTYGQRS